MAAYPPQQPPAYSPQGYPPQPGYPPQGYPPQGYPPQGYPPQGYPPQPYPQAAPMQQQQQSNVVVVGGGAPAMHHTTVVTQRQGTNHLLHLLITLLFWPWIIVWIIFCIIEGVQYRFLCLLYVLYQMASCNGHDLSISQNLSTKSATRRNMEEKQPDSPPAYSGQSAPPPQGYPPQGYPPQGYPPQGYPPQGYPPQGYPPQPYQGYPPQGYAPAPQQQQQSNTTVVVAQPQAAAASTTVVVNRRATNHCMHCCITFFFWPWIFVWIYLMVLVQLNTEPYPLLAPDSGLPKARRLEYRMAYQPPQPTYPSQASYPSQQSNVKVNQYSGVSQTTVIVERKPTNHLLHCLITCFFPPWIFVWIYLCIVNP
ncbi:uncharacterized protein LOC134179692 [Corticium candelabrum]|uniref:uncharacterized protein LOC134179692 n=1 Tax=Corticium candelabrum TaxID=121492 RepID=UPI002E26CA28|nr:uncharacterized protein LOC134179692 [Corticium candelabrum]